jgi:ketosteroid isomerase-like protein
MRLLSIGVLCLSILMLALANAARPTNADLKRQVVNAERAFAATMKARDHAAFRGFLAEEAIFFDRSTPLRGRDAIARAWRP